MDRTGGLNPAVRSMTGKRRLADLHVGDEYETPGIVVTEAHIVAFAGIGGDFFEVHMDDSYAKSVGFPGRVAHGILGLALVDGLKNRSDFRIDAVASLEWQYRFMAPICAGDRIHARIRILDARRTTDGRRGVVRLAIDVLNQHETMVQHGVNTLLVNA